MNKSSHMIADTIKYYCLLRNFTCVVGIGEDYDVGRVKGRDGRTRTLSKCPYPVQRTWKANRFEK